MKDKCYKVNIFMKNNWRWILFLIILVVVAIEVMKPTSIQIKEEVITVKAGIGEGTEIKIQDVKEVYLKDDIPSYKKTFGINFNKINRGKFQVNELGEGHLYIKEGNKPYLYIITEDDFIIINFEDSKKATEYYEEIKEARQARVLK